MNFLANIQMDLFHIFRWIRIRNTALNLAPMLFRKNKSNQVTGTCKISEPTPSLSELHTHSPARSPRFLSAWRTRSPGKAQFFSYYIKHFSECQWIPYGSGSTPDQQHWIKVIKTESGFFLPDQVSKVLNFFTNHYKSNKNWIRSLSPGSSK